MLVIVSTMIAMSASLVLLTKYYDYHRRDRLSRLSQRILEGRKDPKTSPPIGMGDGLSWDDWA